MDKKVVREKVKYKIYGYRIERGRGKWELFAVLNSRTYALKWSRFIQMFGHKSKIEMVPWKEGLE